VNRISYHLLIKLFHANSPRGSWHEHEGQEKFTPQQWESLAGQMQYLLQTTTQQLRTPEEAQQTATDLLQAKCNTTTQQLEQLFTLYALFLGQGVAYVPNLLFQTRKDDNIQIPFFPITPEMAKCASSTCLLLRFFHT
jgi:hypothetical protein